MPKLELKPWRIEIPQMVWINDLDEVSEVSERARELWEERYKEGVENA